MSPDALCVGASEAVSDDEAHAEGGALALGASPLAVAAALKEATGEGEADADPEAEAPAPEALAAPLADAAREAVALGDGRAEVEPEGESAAPEGLATALAVSDSVEVVEAVGDDVKEDVGVGVSEGVLEGDCVSDEVKVGEKDSVELAEGVCEGVSEKVELGERVPEGERLADCEGVAELEGVALGDVPDVNEGVGVAALEPEVLGVKVRLFVGEGEGDREKEPVWLAVFDGVELAVAVPLVEGDKGGVPDGEEPAEMVAESDPVALGVVDSLAVGVGEDERDFVAVVLVVRVGEEPVEGELLAATRDKDGVALPVRLGDREGVSVDEGEEPVDEDLDSVPDTDGVPEALRDGVGLLLGVPLVERVLDVVGVNEPLFDGEGVTEGDTDREGDCVPLPVPELPSDGVCVPEEVTEGVFVALGVYVPVRVTLGV